MAAGSDARLTRNHDGDLLLVDGECTTLVARCYTALWWAIVGHGSPDGPMMRRGSRGDGSEWMGTMRECLEDARQAAHVEARAGDEARAEAKRLRVALSIYQHAVESGMVESDLRKAYENAATLLDGVHEGDSYDAIWNALQRIDAAAAALPTYAIKHEGGIEAFTQNIVDAIAAAGVRADSMHWWEQHHWYWYVYLPAAERGVRAIDPLDRAKQIRDRIDALDAEREQLWHEYLRVLPAGTVDADDIAWAQGRATNGVLEACPACGEGSLMLRFTGRVFVKTCSHCHSDLGDQVVSEFNLAYARGVADAAKTADETRNGDTK